MNEIVDKRLMNNDAAHLCELTVDNGSVLLYLKDAEFGVIVVSKYWANDYWSASGHVNGLLSSAHSESMIAAIARLHANLLTLRGVIHDGRPTP